MDDEILKLAYGVSTITGEKIRLIEDITHRTRILALNARIEAMRAGRQGAAFGIVAQEISQVSQQISAITSELRESVTSSTKQIETAGERLMIEFNGTRMTDLSLNAIELIDRNLYERSCDVRWWATDSAVVDVALDSTPQNVALAADRLATILRSYTVYLDLWVVNVEGIVVSSGRSGRYKRVLGADVSKAGWFKNAMATQTGDDFTVANVEQAALLGDAKVATYAAAIREGGRTNGGVLGVLGIFFDWEPQASAIVKGVGLSPEEKDQTRVLLLDAGHRILAASDGIGELTATYPVTTGGDKAGYYVAKDRLVAFSLTPGYETYEGLGWLGVIERKLAATQTA